MSSGDRALIDRDGLHYITGRIKDLLVTSGGENVAPAPIEHALLKELDTWIAHAVVVGDGQRFLSALLVRKKNVDINDGDIEEGIARANENAVNNVHKIKKWKLLDENVTFSVAGGELGPTLKVKRSVVMKKYRAEIESLY